MNAKQVVALIRSRIAEIVGDGPAEETSITVASLRRVLDTLEPVLDTDTAMRIEHAKLQHASDLAKYAADVEVGKSVIDTAKTLIRSLILINGGSAVALLAFIGHLATRPQGPLLIGSFAVPLGCFVVGVGTAVLFAGFLCLGQKFHAEKWTRSGNATVPLSVLLALTSITAFMIGGYQAYIVFAKI